VLNGGCDKTTPGLFDGRDLDEPSRDLSARGAGVGALERQALGTARMCGNMGECAGNITDSEWNEMEDGIARSARHCMTMAPPRP